MNVREENIILREYLSITSQTHAHHMACEFKKRKSNEIKEKA